MEMFGSAPYLPTVSGLKFRLLARFSFSTDDTFLCTCESGSGEGTVERGVMRKRWERIVGGEEERQV
jgi:hypothetical protein